jgi:hypothetical protein
MTPHAPDTVLAPLFDWAARMGLVGASVVAESLLIGTTMRVHAGNVPDAPLALTYTPPYYMIAAPNIGWSVRFPYYFMITTAGHRRANTGVETYNVMLSTLFGAHDSGLHGMEGADHSQSTIVLLSASRADSAVFVLYWLNAMGFTVADLASESLVPGATTYRAPANASHILRECVMVSAARGVLMIMYLGLPGTFEDNRPHFLALLRTLTTS